MDAILDLAGPFSSTKLCPQGPHASPAVHQNPEACRPSEQLKNLCPLIAKLREPCFPEVQHLIVLECIQASVPKFESPKMFEHSGFVPI